MKVLDLHCSQQHSFEGWFASEDDFQSQLARGLVTCPLCADATITKKLSAPRLNLTTSRGERGGGPARQVESEPMQTKSASDVSETATAHAQEPHAQEPHALEPAQLQAALLKMVRHVVANTEDVGSSFPEEARKMHYGETEHRNIRGQASPQETEALLDEGISVLPLPMPEALKETLQ
jgi:hypothetical protein